MNPLKLISGGGMDFKNESGVKDLGDMNVRVDQRNGGAGILSGMMASLQERPRSGGLDNLTGSLMGRGGNGGNNNLLYIILAAALVVGVTY